MGLVWVAHCRLFRKNKGAFLEQNRHFSFVSDPTFAYLTHSSYLIKNESTTTLFILPQTDKDLAFGGWRIACGLQCHGASHALQQ
jgi:hypothetical protein